MKDIVEYRIFLKGEVMSFTLLWFLLYYGGSRALEFFLELGKKSVSNKHATDLSNSKSLS